MQLLMVTVVIVAAVVATAGVTYALSRPNLVTTTNTDVYRRTTHNMNLWSTGVRLMTILSFTVPKGSWVISASVEAVQGGGGAGDARCGVYAGPTELDGQAGNLDSSSIASINPVGAFTTATKSKVTLQCWDDLNLATPNYIDTGATLLAHRATSLNLS
jgi:hypothetical protein